ncbi:MAG: histidyl-tRNA synthetase, partial [Bacteroidia bacterium]
RKDGLQAIVFPDLKRINKQFDFANKIGVKYALVVGDTEMSTGNLTVKNLIKGEQQTLSYNEALAYLKN